MVYRPGTSLLPVGAWTTVVPFLDARPFLATTGAAARCQPPQALGFGSAATTAPPLSCVLSDARRQPFGVQALPFLGCGNKSRTATVSLKPRDSGSPFPVRPEGVRRVALDTGQERLPVPRGG
ncbi:hypothetical protein B0H65DRAFT_446880 [Neurospora tetraspora]|uniref:Uncharacterized protein n=1 Tax=Neurospora tetraspora TaxID=94610 RepID=A0AAE0J0V1_9PEZI|nr:hypothetical protein B0H65DRAFT_446880 [Neurospora tetraspora]